MNAPCSWPEQDAFWAWNEKHGFLISHEQEEELKKAVSAYRVSQDEKYQAIIAEKDKEIAELQRLLRIESIMLDAHKQAIEERSEQLRASNEALVAAEVQLELAVRGYEALATLGNGDELGNSDGNIFAQNMLLRITLTDRAALAERDAKHEKAAAIIAENENEVGAKALERAAKRIDSGCLDSYFDSEYALKLRTMAAELRAEW